jgi:hypothetical protein
MQEVRITSYSQALINKIERVYGYQVAIVFMDRDVGNGRAEANTGSSAQEVLTKAGIKVKTRSLDTPAQLGGAERARTSIVTAARVPRIHASLPKTLANELVCKSAQQLGYSTLRQRDLSTGVHHMRWSLACAQTFLDFTLLEAMDLCSTSTCPEETSAKIAPFEGFLVSVQHGYHRGCVSLAPRFARYTINYISRNSTSYLLSHLSCAYNRSE